MGTAFEEAMKARIKKGFSEWNGGYEGWLKWCNTLYEPDSHYNVYGQHWTLQQYKDAMGQPGCGRPSAPWPGGAPPPGWCGPCGRGATSSRDFAVIR